MSTRWVFGRKRSLVFALLSGIVAIPLTWYIVPGLYVQTVPVILDMQAPSTGHIELRWGKALDEAIALAPIHQLEIIATGQKDKRSQGSEVQIQRVLDGNGNWIPPWLFVSASAQGWEIHDRGFISYAEQPATLVWQGTVDRELKVVFMKYDRAGQALIRWDGREQYLDLYSATEDTLEVQLPAGNAQRWIGELPPQRIPDLWLQLQNITEGTFRHLSINSEPPQEWEGQVLFEQREQMHGLTVVARSAAGWQLRTGADPVEIKLPSFLPINSDRVPVVQWVLGWLGLTAVILLISALIIIPCLVTLPGNIGDGMAPAITPEPERRGVNQQWSCRPLLVLSLIFLLVLCVHIFYSISLPVLGDWDNDTQSYLVKAVALAERSTFDTGGYEYELNRTPGYPLFLAAVIKFFGYSISAVGLAQHVLFCVAVLLLSIVLLLYVPLYASAAFLVLAGLSPFQMHYCRTVLSESLFASFSMLTFASFLMLVRTRSRWSRVWLAAYAVLLSSTMVIRISGISLAAPFFLYLVGGIRYKAVRTRLLSELLMLILILGTVLLLWSYRNYQARGFFGISDMSGVQRVVGLMEQGIFNPNVPAMRPYYYDHFTLKLNTKDYVGWHLRRSVFFRVTQYYTEFEGSVAATNDILNAIADESVRSNPRAYFASIARTFYQAITLSKIANTPRVYPLRVNLAAFGPSSTADVRAILNRISQQFIYDDRNPSLFFEHVVLPLAAYYHQIYPMLLGSAIISAILCLRYHRGWASGLLCSPISVFLANCAFISSMLTPNARYVQINDIFLWVQCVIGLDIILRQCAGAMHVGRRSSGRSAEELVHPYGN